MTGKTLICAAIVAAAAFGNAEASSLRLFATDQEQLAEFEIEGDTAYLEGGLGEKIRDKVARLLKDHPDLRWIVTEYVPGSDSDSNLDAGRLVRRAAVSTYVPADGMIASGGTDFFLSGAARIVEEGACIGVHSWADDGDARRAADIPRNDEAHRIYLDYYRDIGIDEAFYWFTLGAADADGMHWMTEAEIRRFGVATEWRPTDRQFLDQLPPCDDR